MLVSVTVKVTQLTVTEHAVDINNTMNVWFVVELVFQTVTAIAMATKKTVEVIVVVLMELMSVVYAWVLVLDMTLVSVIVKAKNQIAMESVAEPLLMTTVISVMAQVDLLETATVKVIN